MSSRDFHALFCDKCRPSLEEIYFVLLCGCGIICFSIHCPVGLLKTIGNVRYTWILLCCFVYSGKPFLQLFTHLNHVWNVQGLLLRPGPTERRQEGGWILCNSTLALKPKPSWTSLANVEKYSLVYITFPELLSSKSKIRTNGSN